MLLALTITSTVAGVISALVALGILPQRRAQPQAVVIIIDDIKAFAVERQPDHKLRRRAAAPAQKHNRIKVASPARRARSAEPGPG